MNFPFAQTTFTIKRPGQVVQQGYNHVIAPDATIATGVPVALRDLNGFVNAENGANIQEGMYRGTCRVGTNVQTGDLLVDETNKEPNGDAVTYQVQQTTKYPFHIKLHLHRTVVGT